MLHRLRRLMSGSLFTVVFHLLTLTEGLASAVFTGSPREDFSVEQYHDFSDVTMEAILKSLEKLLDETALPDYEVDYSVSTHR